MIQKFERIKQKNIQRRAEQEELFLLRDKGSSVGNSLFALKDKSVSVRVEDTDLSEIIVPDKKRSTVSIKTAEMDPSLSPHSKNQNSQTLSSPSKIFQPPGVSSSDISTAKRRHSKDTDKDHQSMQSLGSF